MAITAVCLLVLGTSTASAYTGGYAGGGTSCSPCHDSGTVTPLITGLATLFPSQTATYTASITPTLEGAGLNIATTAGSLATTATGTEIDGDSGELIHNQKNVGVWSYDFEVTAPATLGTFDLLGALLAFNNAAGGSGDPWDTTTFQITVIPEPSTFALAGLGMIGICAGCMKKRRQ
jgi:hypothetical protein